MTRGLFCNAGADEKPGIYFIWPHVEVFLSYTNSYHNSSFLIYEINWIPRSLTSSVSKQVRCFRQRGMHLLDDPVLTLAQTKKDYGKLKINAASSLFKDLSQKKNFPKKYIYIKKYSLNEVFPFYPDISCEIFSVFSSCWLNALRQMYLSNIITTYRTKIFQHVGQNKEAIVAESKPSLISHLGKANQPYEIWEINSNIVGLARCIFHLQTKDWV